MGFAALNPSYARQANASPALFFDGAGRASTLFPFPRRGMERRGGAWGPGEAPRGRGINGPSAGNTTDGGVPAPGLTDPKRRLPGAPHGGQYVGRRSSPAVRHLECVPRTGEDGDYIPWVFDPVKRRGQEILEPGKGARREGFHPSCARPSCKASASTCRAAGRRRLRYADADAASAPTGLRANAEKTPRRRTVTSVEITCAARDA